jgi:transcriptional regulator with XRE-family HTH domain
MKEDLNNILAQNIKQLMDARGWNQRQLADATRGEVTQKTVSNVLAELPCGMAIIESIAKALQVEPWRLLVAPESAVVALVDTYASADESGRALIEKLVERERAIRPDRGPGSKG